MTRMWNVNPTFMCDKHLRGEYHEIHKALGGFANHPHGIALLRGHQKKGNIDLSTMSQRYEKLQVEMKNRGFKHDAAIIHTPFLEHGYETQISRKRALEDLWECSECRKRIRQNMGKI